jgi:4-hydroxybenzoate polyprenyltransferase
MTLPTSRPAAKPAAGRTLIAWLRLVRFPNVFTVIADGLTGLAIARATWLPLPLTVAIVSSLVLLYWGGMMLNDVFDREKDHQQKRRRPLVDGSIDPGVARLAGFGCLIIGLLILAIGCWYAAEGGRGLASWIPSLWMTVGLGLAIMVCVLLYDGPLKPTRLAPWCMGLCRMGSLLLGISVGWWLEPKQVWFAGHFWMLAAGHGLYVAGITWAARREADQIQDWTLRFGWLLSLLGVLCIAAGPWFTPPEIPLRLGPDWTFFVGLCLLAGPWIRRAMTSVLNPTPMTIQPAVKQAILTIIFFDALMVMQYAGPWPAMLVCSLIVPAVLSGKYLAST